MLANTNNRQPATNAAIIAHNPATALNDTPPNFLSDKYAVSIIGSMNLVRA